MGKPAAVGKDVLTCFHLAMATWTMGVLCREKALSELSNGSMVENGLSCPGTQGDRLTNKGKPAPTPNQLHSRFYLFQRYCSIDYIDSIPLQLE